VNGNYNEPVLRTTQMSTRKTYTTGILGKKLGMTQIFTDDGTSIPVTVIQAGPCYVLGTRDETTHGYSAVQLGFEPKKMQRVGKPEAGQFAKAGKGAFYHVRELRCDSDDLRPGITGDELRVGDIFKQGCFIDVSGLSIGKGFAGVVKRYGMRGQPATRGTHENRRHVGSIGCRKFPGRVFKNKRMPGRMGNKKVTVQNLEVVGIRPEENLILVKGGVPGARGGVLLLRSAIKSSTKSA
jgi:large subunit ribosomal protein L3